METFLMDVLTGAVASESEWRADFEAIPADRRLEEWGGTTFENADLVEVVPNIPGEPGYDDRYGEWREPEE